MVKKAKVKGDVTSGEWQPFEGLALPECPPSLGDAGDEVARAVFRHYFMAQFALLRARRSSKKTAPIDRAVTMGSSLALKALIDDVCDILNAYAPPIKKLTVKRKRKKNA